MATKPKTQIMSHDNMVMSPITKASNVLFEDGKTAQDKLEDNVEKSFTPSIENSSSMFKVGQGDNVDYSGNVIDGAYEECVLKGRSLVNCIQEPSSKDVILPYEFTEGQYVTIDDTKDSGALGVELKGQTLVNLVVGGNERKQVGKSSGTIAKYKYVYPLDHTKVYTLYFEISGFVGTNSLTVSVTRGNTGFFSLAKDGKYKVKIEPKANYAGLMTEIWAYWEAQKWSDGNQAFIENIMILEGDYTNQDIPYFEGMASVKAPTVKTAGKNLFDGMLQSGYLQDATGMPTGKLGLHGLTYIPCKPNTTYVISGTLGNVVPRFYFYDKNKKYLDYVPGQSPFRVFTSHPNSSFMRIRLFSNSVLDISQYGQIQIEEGTQATTYEPYKSSSLTLPEEVVLRSLPSGVCDTFNTRTGEYVRRIGEVTVDGSTGAWGLSKDSSGATLYVTISGIPNTLRAKGVTALLHGGAICNRLHIDNPYHVVTHHNCVGVYESNVRIKLENIETTVEAYKSWLQSNPITVQYELAEPIITKINLSSTLKPHNTTTHIYSEIPQNSLYPILSHSNPTYPVILKPSTKYSIVANPYSNNHTNSPINFNLGGATASATVGNRVTTVTTPSTLSNDLLTMSGRGNKLNHVMVIEGEVVGDEPYFEGICDVKSPVLSNLYNVYALSSAINQDWYSGDFNVTISPNQMSYHSCPPINIASLRQKKVYTGLARDGVVLREKNSFVVYFNSLGKRIGSRFGGSENGFTIPQEVTYIRLMHGIGGQSLNYIGRDEYFISTEKFEVGDKIIYKSNMTTFNQKDGKIIILRSLPNGVCDTLNVETGECVSNIAQIVLNGSENENWKLYYDASSVKNPRSFFITLAEGQTAKPGQNIFATDRYPVKKLTTQECAWYFDLNGHKIAFSDIASRCADVSKWREYLKANPITLCYQRISPIITTIDVQSFPYAYKDGHVQLSSDYNGQSLTPKIEYSLPINRNCQIRTNQAMVERHQKQIDELQAIILANLVNNQYKQTLATLQYELSRV